MGAIECCTVGVPVGVEVRCEVVVVRANSLTDEEWYKSLKPGWHQERMRNFIGVVRGTCEFDMINDGWTQTFQRMSGRMKSDMTMEEFDHLRQIVDYKIMENIRARVDAVIQDKDTAVALKPWYNQLCKRPCYHDE